LFSSREIPVGIENSIRVQSASALKDIATPHLFPDAGCRPHYDPAMILLRLVVIRVCVGLGSRGSVALENLAPRHQAPQDQARDRAFWNALSDSWSVWRSALIIVKPETVVRWHRAGFRLFL
jgi:hypothetical protein